MSGSRIHDTNTTGLLAHVAGPVMRCYLLGRAHGEAAQALHGSTWKPPTKAVAAMASRLGTKWMEYPADLVYDNNLVWKGIRMLPHLCTGPEFLKLTEGTATGLLVTTCSIRPVQGVVAFS